MDLRVKVMASRQVTEPEQVPLTSPGTDKASKSTHLLTTTNSAGRPQHTQSCLNYEKVWWEKTLFYPIIKTEFVDLQFYLKRPSVWLTGYAHRDAVTACQWSRWLSQKKPARTVLSAITCRDCTAHRMKGTHRRRISEIPFTCFSYRRVSIFRNAKPRDKSYAFVSNLCHDKCRSYRQLLGIWKDVTTAAQTAHNYSTTLCAA
jgi:hypothetical protein